MDTDNDQKYEEALTLYMHSISIFMHVLKCKFLSQTPSPKPIPLCLHMFGYLSISLLIHVPVLTLELCANCIVLCASLFLFRLYITAVYYNK